MALIGPMKYLTIGGSTYEIQGQEITSSAITSALGYTPYNGSTNPNGYITSDSDTKVTNIYGNNASSGNVMLYSTQSLSSTVTSTNTCGALKFSSSGVLQIGKAHSSEGSQGSISLSNSGGSNLNYTSIVPSGTEARTITLPNKTGTVALISDIPTVYNASTNPNGYLTLATLPIYDGTVN